MGWDVATKDAEPEFALHVDQVRRHVVCLSWSHIHRRINLSDNWADYYQDRFALPELVVAPFNVTRSWS